VTTELNPGLSDRLRALIRAIRIVRQRLTIQDTQVQPGMIGILAAIGNAEDGRCCHPKELATQCALDASTISRAVATLVARGLVRSRPDPADGRARILALTAAGRAALADVERRQAEFLREALRDWTAPEVDTFAAGLTRFVDDLTAHLDRTSVPPATPAGSVPETPAPPAPAGRAPETSERETPKLEAAL
jgi:DNA-binding MarR family transcriptional regulator